MGEWVGKACPSLGIPLTLCMEVRQTVDMIRAAAASMSQVLRVFPFLPQSIC